MCGGGDGWSFYDWGGGIQFNSPYSLLTFSLHLSRPLRFGPRSSTFGSEEYFRRYKKMVKGECAWGKRLQVIGRVHITDVTPSDQAHIP